MNKENTDRLWEKYSDIFRERNLDTSKTLVCCGFSCGDGWYKIIDKLCKNLQTIQKLTNIQVIVKQVKEKYATLRFYYILDKPTTVHILWNEIIRDLIDDAENKSATTCEICGKKGKLRIINVWYTTLCNKCYIKKYEQNDK